MPRLAVIAMIAVVLFAVNACSAGSDEAGGAAGGAVSADEAREALAAFGLDEPGRITWASRSQDGAAFTFEDVALREDGRALSAARLVLASPQVTEDGPVFQRFEVTEAVIDEAEGLRAGLARLTITDAGPELGRALAAALRGEEAEDGEPHEWRFGEISLSQLAVNGVSETGQPLDLTLDAASAAGADGDTIETLRLEDLAFATTDAQGAPLSVTLGALSADAVAAGLAGFTEGRSAAPAAPLAGALTPNTQYDRFSMTDLEVRASGLRIVMPSLAGAVEEAGDDRLISRTAMERLSITPDAEAGGAGERFARALDQLGYDAMNFSLANAVAYDLEADRVQTIEQNYLRLEDGFTLRFEQVARGAAAYAQAYDAWLERGGETGGAAPPAAVFEPLEIERMVIRLEDQSLLDRSLGALAEMQGATPEQLRMQAGAYVALGAAFAGDMVPPQALSALQAALTGFINEGGTLTVTLAPDEPVSMATLMESGGDADAEALGLTIDHEGP